jgi:hypothetical protein
LKAVAGVEIVYNSNMAPIWIVAIVFNNREKKQTYKKAGEKTTKQERQSESESVLIVVETKEARLATVFAVNVSCRKKKKPDSCEFNFT